MAEDAMDVDGPSYLEEPEWLHDPSAETPAPAPAVARIIAPMPSSLRTRSYNFGRNSEDTKAARPNNLPVYTIPVSATPVLSYGKRKYNFIRNSAEVKAQWPNNLPIFAAPLSSGGKKRTYDAYTTDIAQTKLGWDQPRSQFLAPAPEAPTPEAPKAPRRIGGMLTSLYQASRGIVNSIASIWGYMRGQYHPEIVAVETSPMGNKRRAVEADMTPKALTQNLPGAFPDVKQETPPPEPAQQEPVAQLETPPASRPTSSQENKKHDSPMAEQMAGPREYTLDELANWTWDTLPKHIITVSDYRKWQAPLEAVRAAERAARQKEEAERAVEREQEKDKKREAELEEQGKQWARSFEYRVRSKQTLLDVMKARWAEEDSEPEPKGKETKQPRKPVVFYPPHVEEHRKELFKRDQEQAKVEPGSQAWKWYEAMKKENPTDRFKRMARKEAEDDELIERAKRATMLSPEDRMMRVKFRRCRMLDEYDRARNLYDAEPKARIDQKVKKAVYDEKVRLAEIRLGKEAAYEEELRRKQESQNEAVKKAEREAEAARLKAQQEAIERELQEEKERQEANELKLQEEAAQYYEARQEEKRQEELRKALSEKAKITDSDVEWLEKEKLIRPVDKKWHDKLAKEMNVKRRDHVVAKTVDGTGITRKDFGTLLPQEGTEDDPSGWLNDEIVNGFIGAIVARKLEKTGYKKSANTVPAYAAFSSAWYTNYQKRGGIQNIATWSRRKQIKGEKLLQSEKIFFPINTGNHWMLLIISPKDRTIEFLDSLNSRGGGRKWFKVAREWLEMELGSKYDPNEWTELASQSASQQNSNDCGVFTCFNALAAAKGMEFREVGNGSMNDARMMVGAILMNDGFTGDYEL